MGERTELIGLGALVSAIRQTKPYLEGLALVDVRGKATLIAERAIEIAPVGTPAEGDPHPGAMRADIGLKGEGIDARGPFVDVGTTEPYGLFVEFGTENMQAIPFMRPAIAEVSGLTVMSSRINLAKNKRSKSQKKS